MLGGKTDFQATWREDVRVNLHDTYILRLSNPTTQQAIQHTIPYTNLAPLPCIVPRLRITSRAGLRLRKCAQQISLQQQSTSRRSYLVHTRQCAILVTLPISVTISHAPHNFSETRNGEFDCDLSITTEFTAYAQTRTKLRLYM